jgi:hypothetical protein
VSADGGSRAGAEPAEEELRLRAERDEAVRQLDREGRRVRRRSRTRRVFVGALVVVFAILLPVTLTAAWAHRTVLDTNTYIDTVSPIARDPAVTAALSREITNQLFVALDPQKQVADALPPQAAFLAGPVTRGAKGYVADSVDQVLGGPRFQTLWVSANRFAHTQLVNVLRDKSRVTQTTNGYVTLNLVPLLNTVLASVQGFASNAVGHQVTIPAITANELPSTACASIASALQRPVPPTCGQIPLFQAAKLNQARRGVEIFDRGVLALLIVTPLVFLAALLLSRRRRRTLLQLTIWGALGIVVVRRAAIVLRSDLISTGRPQNKSARSAIAHQVLAGFFSLTTWFLIGAAVIVAVALLTGPYRWAVSLRASVRTAAAGMAEAMRGGQVTGNSAVAFIRRHFDLLRGGGVVVALLLLIVLPVNLWGVLIILAVLAGYEAGLHRMRPPAVVALPEPAPPPGAAPQQAAAGTAPSAPVAPGAGDRR